MIRFIVFIFYGVENIIRIGSCGTYTAELKVKEEEGKIQPSSSL